MSTNVRPEIAKKNNFYISKHRYYELLHFCMQYWEWDHAYRYLHEKFVFHSNFDTAINGENQDPSDYTAKIATEMAYYSNRMELITKTAEETDKDLARYILLAVTEGYSYSKLKAREYVPACREVFYSKYREFFWRLSKKRD